MDKNNTYKNLDKKLKELYREHELSPPENSWEKISAEFEALDLAAFDKKIQNKISEEEHEVPEHLWATIEENAEEKKKRKVLFYWWFLGAFLLGIIYMASAWQNQRIEKNVETGTEISAASGNKLSSVKNDLGGKPGQGLEQGVGVEVGTEISAASGNKPSTVKNDLGEKSGQGLEQGVGVEVGTEISAASGNKPSTVKNDLGEKSGQGLEQGVGVEAGTEISTASGNKPSTVNNDLGEKSGQRLEQGVGVEVGTEISVDSGNKPSTVKDSLATKNVIDDGLEIKEKEENNKLLNVIEKVKKDSINNELKIKTLEDTVQKSLLVAEKINFLESIELTKINFTDSILQLDTIRTINKEFFEKNKKIKIAIEPILSLGYSNNFIVDTLLFFNKRTNGNFLLDIGIRINFEINKRLAVLTGIHYRNFSSIHALYLPFYARYKLGNKRLKPLISLGVNVSYLFLSEAGFSQSTNPYINSIGYSNVRKLNINGVIGFGLEYQLTSKWAIVFMPTFHYTFLNINKNGQLGVYPYSVQFDTGIKYFF